MLNELLAYYPQEKIHYWRDKQGHEVDFVLLRNRKAKPVYIECKWNSHYFEYKSLQSFRRKHPEGKNYVVSPDIPESYDRKHDDFIVTYISLENLIKELLEDKS